MLFPQKLRKVLPKLEEILVSDAIEVGMGKAFVGSAPALITTSGIGSCVAVCLWDQTQKKGGLAHIMLPQSPATDISANLNEDSWKYADIAILGMLTQLESDGVNKAHLIAKIAGGANMFPGIQARSQKMGERNSLFLH